MRPLAELGRRQQMPPRRWAATTELPLTMQHTYANRVPTKSGPTARAPRPTCPAWAKVKYMHTVEGAPAKASAAASACRKAGDRRARPPRTAASPAPRRPRGEAGKELACRRGPATSTAPRHWAAKRHSRRSGEQRADASVGSSENSARGRRFHFAKVAPISSGCRGSRAAGRCPPA